MLLVNDMREGRGKRNHSLYLSASMPEGGGGEIPLTSPFRFSDRGIKKASFN